MTEIRGECQDNLKYSAKRRGSTKGGTHREYLRGSEVQG